VAGIRHSAVDRRWDGVSIDKTLGSYSILACRKAMDDPGVSPDQIDGVICCETAISPAAAAGSASKDIMDRASHRSS
jgi:3-oxoacyl-[acyl-carrier-protein] synthase III